MYDISFVSSSVYGYLGSLLVLDIMNNAAMNIVESLWYDYASLGYYPQEWYLEVDWSPIFWGTTIVISKVTVQVCTHTSNGGVFPLLHIL